jgi:hypothetical protein
MFKILESDKIVKANLLCWIEKKAPSPKHQKGRRNDF